MMHVKIDQLVMAGEEHAVCDPALPWRRMFFKQKKCCGNHKSFQTRDVISAKRVNMSSEKDPGAESGAETKMDP